MATKNCFIDKARPCDLTCKAAFPVDDAVDPVDCFFIWMAGHLGDGVIDVRQFLEQRGFNPPGGAPPSAGPSGSGQGPAPGSGHPDSGGSSGPQSPPGFDVNPN